ncbi:hypothetical protein FIU95_10630 [Microbulbifer sp. THAF38]|nr:hypothetical protein FIU95_10630 [Microbulbifer sp. THAF38]
MQENWYKNQLLAMNGGEIQGGLNNMRRAVT